MTYLETADSFEIEGISSYQVYRGCLNSLTTGSSLDYSNNIFLTDSVEIHDAFSDFQEKELHIFSRSAKHISVTLKNKHSSSEFTMNIDDEILNAKEGIYAIVTLYPNPYNSEMEYDISVALDNRVIYSEIKIPRLMLPYIPKNESENPFFKNTIELLETNKTYEIFFPRIHKTLTLYGSTDMGLYYPIRTWLSDSFNEDKMKLTVKDKCGFKYFYFKYGESLDSDNFLCRDYGVIFTMFH